MGKALTSQEPVVQVKCRHCGKGLTILDLGDDDTEYRGEDRQGRIVYLSLYKCPDCGGYTKLRWTEGTARHEQVEQRLDNEWLDRNWVI